MIQKYCFVVILLTWLQLGASLRFSSKQLISIEERLQKLEDFVAQMKAEESIAVQMHGVAIEDGGFLAPSDDGVTEQDVITVSGCEADATAFINQFLAPLVQEFKEQFTAIKVNCGKCSSVSFEGPYHGSVTLCKSSKGTPCVNQLEKMNCPDPHHDDDLKFPFRLPIDGTSTIGEVDMIMTVDKTECFTLVTPPDYTTC
ncbi:hypothetical protein EMCRGX_G033418 [Ephydatia muelleri]|eukprot:Em0022g806a